MLASRAEACPTNVFLSFPPALQSGFVTRSLTLALLWIALCTGCARLPESFPPPEQRAPLVVPPAGTLGYFLSMADPNADAYLVKDVADRGPGTWRWAYRSEERRAGQE